MSAKREQPLYIPKPHYHICQVCGASIMCYATNNDACVKSVLDKMAIERQWLIDNGYPATDPHLVLADKNYHHSQLLKRFDA